MRGPADLREQARACRELAAGADDGTAASLRMLAAEYEAEAARLEAALGPHPVAKPEV